MKQVLLLSGGIDSAALLYWKRPDLALTIDYGQRPARGEVRASRFLCKTLRIPHDVVRVDCRAIGAGLMAPGSERSNANPHPEWWPFRNQLVITLAAAHVVSSGGTAMLIGTVSTDGRRHRDGTAGFVRALHRVLALQEGGVRLEAPAIGMTSTQLVRRSKIPSSLLLATHSCHTSDDACGRCPGCVKHTRVTARFERGAIRGAPCSA
jgi:7-cyano-7-deazaguanine synthase